MKKEENYELIEKIIISIDSIYEITKLDYLEISVFSTNEKLIDNIKVILINISQFAKKIDFDLFDNKDLKFLNKLVGFDKYSHSKLSNKKNIYNLIYSRELALINIRLLEIQNEKFGKSINKVELVLMKKINKNMKFTFKTM
ncbi:hypothetical protein ACFQZF_11225 [Flavobacterium myungsuense]|uniref:Uncharacterized protein n=1 Tax=Flavobacterium myungsuense TaxID=651823 RepID=A0ABW3J0C6_9FLAO